MTGCDRTPGCARLAGHSGVCTACPNPATLAWDRDKIPDAQIDAAVTLLALDFPAPPWADLRDPL